ncbi:MAG: hypothetical protein ACHQQ3_04745 [Gemmatimonadales bacterium]
MTDARTDRLQEIASDERESAREFVEELLPADARVSVYLFQPVIAEGLRPESPGVLFDIGPAPASVGHVDRGLLYQCAEAGRTGSFLQSADDCTRRVPQTTEIDRQAYASYRSFNGCEAARRAQIAVERERHGFEPQTDDGPPMGWHIHHLALAPRVHSFSALATGRIPVLGTVFTVTKEAKPDHRREYSNLVDYAIFIAEEALEIRATQLLGSAHVGADFAGSAIEKLLEDPASDEALQLVAKLLFAHHWFFPYDAVAHSLLARAVGGTETAHDLYVRHGWSAPLSRVAQHRDDHVLRQLVIGDTVTLIRHLSWYRLGKEFRPRPHQVLDAVTRALNTALLFLCGTPADVPTPRTAPSYQRRARDRFLAPPSVLADPDRNDSLLAPVFPLSGIRQLIRGTEMARFDKSFAACGPGYTEGHTRTHLKPSGFVESFDRGGIPRFSAKTHDGVRDRTKWLCSYAIARLAESAIRERGGNGEARHE